MKNILLKVKDGKLETWKEWCLFLENHRDEVLDTLNKENCTREMAVLFEFDGQHYVHGLMEYTDELVPADMSVALNLKHKEKLQECLEPVSRGDVLFDFKSQDRQNLE